MRALAFATFILLIAAEAVAQSVIVPIPFRIFGREWTAASPGGMRRRPPNALQ